MAASRTRIAVLVVAGVLCASIAAAIALVPAPSAASFGLHAADLPPRTGISPVNYTLYGNAVGGWGFSSTTIREPGPNITVFYGDRVNLTLFGTDSAPHSWFIDYDDDKAASAGEPASKDFNVPGNVVGNFSFDAVQPGNWTYRCGIHPTTMTGRIQILEQARPVNLTLYGDAALGWGLSNATIREPGPNRGPVQYERQADPDRKRLGPAQLVHRLQQRPDHVAGRAQLEGLQRPRGRRGDLDLPRIPDRQLDVSVSCPPDEHDGHDFDCRRPSS